MPRRRGGSAFIAQLIRRALDDEARWDDIESALGALPSAGHDWDDDPAEWVRASAMLTGAADRMARAVLDSTVLIDALRADQRPSAPVSFAVADEPWVRHLRRGDLAQRAARRGGVVRQLFRGLRCAPLGVTEGERAGPGVAPTQSAASRCTRPTA
jgi:hypothetical protein